MAGNADRLDVPDVQDTMPIEKVIGDLRESVACSCKELLRKARIVDAESGKSRAFRLRIWETRITQIREAQATTFSIGELRELSRKCEVLSRQLSQFSKA